MVLSPYGENIHIIESDVKIFYLYIFYSPYFLIIRDKIRSNTIMFDNYYQTMYYINMFVW